MKKIEKTIKKRCKAVLTLILSVVIVMGVVAWPNGVYAKTYGYDGFQTYFNDYAGTILFPGDTVTRDERGDGYLHVRYLIYDRSYNWLELQTTADFLPFYEAWGNADYVIDTDDYMLYKSNFTFPEKPDTGNDDFYIYEVYQSMRTSASRTLANGELADNCAIVEILARPAHKVTFHDKNGDVIDTGANRYFYEMPSGEADVYLMSVSDNEDEPILDSDEKLGEFLGWSNNEEFISTDDNPESAFIYKDRGFDYGSDVSRNEISGLLNFYPVYEYIDTTLEVSTKDFEEGNSIKDNLRIETNRPSDKKDYSISYEKINDDGTIEALNGEPSEAGNYQVIVKLDKLGETVVNNDGIVISRGYSSAFASAKFSITAKEEEKKETEEPKKEETQTEDKKEDEKLKGSVSISMNSFYYGGKAPSPSISSSTNDISKAVVKYKRSGSDDSTYSASVPSEIGTYTASVTVPANEKYEACSNETTFTISYLPTPKDAYTLEAQNGNKGYYISDVKIIPKKGFEISYGDRRHYSGNPIKFDKSMNSISFFLRDETTLEETAVIVIGNIKIDNTAPKILDMQKDGLYFGDDDDFLKAVVSDENIDHVLLGEKSVALKSDDKGNMTFDIPVEKKKTTVTFTVFDEAGNKTEISILVAPGWRKDGRIKKGRLFVPKDEKSIFTEGNNWGTVGKKTVYIGGNDFYPVEEGEYEFEVR